MKKMLAVMAVIFAISQTAALAATVQGTVKSVDTTAMKLEIKGSMDESSSVEYDATTKWPVGVTDPSTLVGKNVSINTDDATKKATAVEEAKAEAAKAEAAAKAPSAAKAAAEEKSEEKTM